MPPKTAHIIQPEQLCIGLYIYLDVGWLDHPFGFGSFKIQSEEQINQVRALGLARLRYDPSRSECKPLPAPAPTAQSADLAKPDAIMDSAKEDDLARQEARRAFRLQRADALAAAVRECERKFAEAVVETQQIESKVFREPAETLGQARKFVDGLVASLLTESDVVLHAMQPRNGVEAYSHPLNVTILALILAKALGLTAQEASCLGLGGLLHDIGKADMPDRILRKSDPLSMAESALLQQHPETAAKFGRKNGMPEPVIRILLQHHECCDGSGYPKHLRQADIDRLARIIAITNTYDNLCNPQQLVPAMTPYEALAHMYARLRAKFDRDILTLLIKGLGVYPPGSTVQLSDGNYGLVLAINPNKPLRPNVLLHQSPAADQKPLLVNLGEEPNLLILRCLRHEQLPPDALQALNPSSRISYFFDRELPS